MGDDPYASDNTVPLKIIKENKTIGGNLKKYLFWIIGHNTL